MKNIFLSICLLFILMPSEAALTFVQSPSIQYNAGNGKWTVAFEVSEATDVEVAVIDLRDSTIVRHLAAGMLGSNPPAPLQAGSLAQSLEWDGKDDLGKTVSASAGSVAVRVRAGLSVGLDRLAGNNPYRLRGLGVGSYYRLQGLVAGADGSVFVYGSTGDLGQPSLRQFDASGNYVKTLFPYPAGLPVSDVSGFGVNQSAGGKYSPKGDWNSGTFTPSFSTSPLTVSGSKLLPIGLNNEIAVGGYQVMLVKTTGAAGGTGASFRLVTSPPYQDPTYYGGGPFYAISSRNPEVIYLSGVYQCIKSSGWLVEAPDTGFWRDGCVYKVDRNTGVARQWITLDSVPVTPAARTPKIGADQNFAAIHGVAEDHLGHVFVCDRWHSRVGVYDTGGTLLGGISVNYPENVAVDTATGALFVLTRYESSTWHVGEIKLLKFAGWQAGGTPVWSRTLTTVLADYASERPYLALARSGAGLLIWTGYLITGIQAYRDDGNTLTLVKDFNAENPAGAAGFSRLAVDRRTEALYIGDTWGYVYKIEDWASAAILPCSTTARRPLLAVDLCISFDNRLYVRENLTGGTSGGWYGPVSRFTLDHYNAPLPYANTGSNQILPVTERAGEGDPSRGIAPSPDGRVYFITESSFGNQLVGSCTDTGAVFNGATAFLVPAVFDTLVYPVNASYCGGIKADLQGNVYLGSNIQTAQQVVPAGFESDFAYSYGAGSVIKFAPGARGSITGTTRSPNVQGALKVYATALAPYFSHDGQTRCFCRNPHFDVDAYGRLFIPNAFTNKVTVADNNGNVITAFGDYGNWDSQGPGSPVPLPSIPLGWPVTAAASDNFIYVGDLLNNRVARVRMDYALNSAPWVPEATAQRGRTAVAADLPSVIASPNPFSESTRLQIRGHAGIRGLAVYDIAGRQVAAWNTVKSEMTWRTAALPAGVYFLQLNTAKGVFSRKVLKLR